MAEETFVPIIGEMVHYLSYGTPGGEYKKECRAALVTAIENPHKVSLAVLNPEGMFFNQGVTRDQLSGQVGGTWHVADGWCESR